MAASHKQIVGKYELGKVLAAGYFDSRMRICTHIVTGAQYVVRIYSKDVLAEEQWMWDRTRDSIQVMRTMPKHENIIETTECFETESSLYILMQMFSPMQVTKLYTSETASGQRIAVPLQKTKHYYIQVVRGLAHMHKHGVVHFGIAPDHIMINDRDQVKIGYLVSCTYFPRGKLIRETRGTTHTVAPEILRNDMYDPYLADAWSMGILLYFMLHQGRYPHDGANTTKNILYNRLRPADPFLPSAARDLLSRLLEPVPSKRMSVEDILLHPFFVDCRTESENHGHQSAPRVSVPMSSLNVTEITANMHARDELSRQERAACIIQHMYRAYRQRKRSYEMGRGTHMYKKSRGLKSNLPNRPILHRGQTPQTLVNMSSEDPDSRCPSHNERPQECDDDYDYDIGGGRDSADGRWEELEESVHADRRLHSSCTVTNSTEKHHFDELAHAHTSNGASEKSADSPITFHVGNSKWFMPGNSASSEHQAPRNSLANKGTMKGAQVHVSEAQSGHPGCRRSTANTTGGLGVGGGGGGGGGGGVGVGPNAIALDSEGRASVIDPLSAAATALAHVKVDAGRPCPLCKRMPMQRLGGREPYKTPFVFKDGEFTYNPIDEN